MEDNYLYILINTVDDSLKVDPNFIDEYWNNLSKKTQNAWYDEFADLSDAIGNEKSDTKMDENYILVLCHLIDAIDEEYPDFIDIYWNDSPEKIREFYYNAISNLEKAIDKKNKNNKNGKNDKNESKSSCGCGIQKTSFKY